MKSAIFEYGKQSLSEWIKMNRDCNQMILKGDVNCDSHDFKLFNLLCGYDGLAKDFHPAEYDIADLHFSDCYGELDDKGIFDYLDDQRPSLIFKMLANRKYGTRFVDDGLFVTTPDKKVLIHCYSIGETVKVPECTEVIGCLAFTLIREPNFKVILPDGVVCIDDRAFEDSDGLIDINFPDSLKTLGEAAFSGTSLKKVILPDGIEEIPVCCFCFVYIDELRLPANLKAIRASAFVGLDCEVVRLPQSVEIIEGDSLEGLYDTIYIPKTIKEQAHDFYYEEGIDDNPEELKPIIISY